MMKTTPYKTVEMLRNAIFFFSSHAIEKPHMTARTTDKTMMVKVPAPMPNTKVDGTSSGMVDRKVGETVGTADGTVDAI